MSCYQKCNGSNVLGLDADITCSICCNCRNASPQASHSISVYQWPLQWHLNQRWFCIMFYMILGFGDSLLLQWHTVRGLPALALSTTSISLPAITKTLIYIEKNVTKITYIIYNNNTVHKSEHSPKNWAGSKILWSASRQPPTINLVDMKHLFSQWFLSLLQIF